MHKPEITCDIISLHSFILLVPSDNDATLSLQKNANVVDNRSGIIQQSPDTKHAMKMNIHSICRMKPPVPRAKSVSVSIHLSA